MGINKHLFAYKILVYCLVLFLAMTGGVIAEDKQCELSSFYLEQQPNSLAAPLKADYTCFVDLQTIKLNEYEIVDSRDTQTFLRGSFRSAKNIAYENIATKPFLDNKKILLVDRGFSKNAISRQCIKLREKHVDAYVLSGGLRGLKENREFASQVSLDLYELVQVESAEVIGELFRYDLLIVIADRDSQNKLAQYGFFDSIFIDYEKNKDDFWNSVAQAKKELSSHNVLIFSDQKVKKQIIKSLVGGLDPSYFIYGGEVTEFATFLEKNKNYNENRNKTPNRYLCNRSRRS